ncbi:MAG: LPXTG cell wall anchor domain-containing protein, partial [Myxococcales bacterium]|nr:LPXTG cell wall anchor domain-containing protein [Myxococcales bacterium]
VSDFVMAKSPTNQLMFVDVVRWLGGEESFAGEISSEEDHPIEHTKKGDTIWFYATILGVPMLVLGLGLLLSRRRQVPARSAEESSSPPNPRGKSADEEDEKSDPDPADETSDPSDEDDEPDSEPGSDSDAEDSDADAEDQDEEEER